MIAGNKINRNNIARKWPWHIYTMKDLKLHTFYNPII